MKYAIHYFVGFTHSQDFLNLQNIDSINLKRTIIYQEFIHSIVRGRLLSERDELERFYSKEKRILRIIAFLKTIYSEELTKDLLQNELEIYGEKYDEKIVEEILDPIIMSYFSLKRKDSYDTTETIDFLHSSFREFLMSEFYIENMIIEKINRIDSFIPSQETMLFFDGLLDIINNKDGLYQKYQIRFIKSCNNNIQNVLKNSNLKKKLIENAEIYYKKETIFFEACEGVSGR